MIDSGSTLVSLLRGNLADAQATNDNFALEVVLLEAKLAKAERERDEAVAIKEEMWGLMPEVQVQAIEGAAEPFDSDVMYAGKDVVKHFKGVVGAIRNSAKETGE